MASTISNDHSQIDENPFDNLNDDENKVTSNRQIRKNQLKQQSIKGNKKNIKHEVRDTKLQDISNSMDVVNTTTCEILPCCLHCGYPRDYCEFGPTWSLCKSEALTIYEKYYQCYLNLHPDEKPIPSNEHKQVDTPNNFSEIHHPPPLEAAPLIKPPVKSKQSTSKKPQITIQRVSRAKHKITTVIIGLDLFEIKLDTVAKLIKKKFACGCSVVKGVPGQMSHVEIQGDFENEVDCILLNNFPQITEDNIIHLNPK